MARSLVLNSNSINVGDGRHGERTGVKPRSNGRTKTVQAGGWSLVLSVVGGLQIERRNVAAVFVEAAVVERMNPFAVATSRPRWCARACGV